MPNFGGHDTADLHDRNGAYAPEIHHELEFGGSHNISLPMVGGNTYVDPSINPELAMAAYDENQAVIVHNGEAFLAPISSINPDAVELACD